MYAAQNRISKFTSVCSYDRAGLGWSDAPVRPMGLLDQVADLQQIIGRIHSNAPLVLVPESGGNLIALTLFIRSPETVAGMVMVDGSEPDLWFRGSPDEFRSMRLMDPVYQAGWHLGVIRLLLPFAVPDWVDALPSNTRGQFDAVWSKPMPSYARDAIDRWERTGEADRPKPIPGLFGNRPLVVIRHGKTGGMGIGEKYEAEWPAAQTKLATLSTNSRIVVAEENHHPIAEENPDLVGEQVRSVVDQLRREHPSPPRPEAAGYSR
jgi:pimeloyl-ACP methyl ester carboxylesterase